MPSIMVQPRADGPLHPWGQVEDDHDDCLAGSEHRRDVRVARWVCHVSPQTASRQQGIALTDR